MMDKSKTVILGSGVSGIGAVKLAQKKGLDIFLSDSKNIKSETKKLLSKLEVIYEEDGHTESLIKDSNEIIISPGIDFRSLIKSKPSLKKKKIISEVEFASRYTNAFIIAVTGTNGKTTTSKLIYHILKNSGFNVGLAGNIGYSFSESIVENQFDYYVLELSSFQLEHIINFRPDISIITNISPDHLDRYDNKLESYADAKFNIIRNQKSSDFFIYNGDCAVTTNKINNINSKASAICFHSSKNKNQQNNYLIHHKNKIKSSINNNENMIDITQSSLIGLHNVKNSMAAIAVSEILNISNKKIIESLKTFQNVPHRLEHFLTIHKVKYVNDSKATNVNATFYALNSFKKPIVWIVGGVDKGNDYSQLVPLVKSNVKAIICLGSDNDKIISTFSQHCNLIVSTNKMVDAVKSAYDISKQGDIVLLSPACASFDLFENFEQRGNLFKDQVRKL
tara:strand:- start:1080 stop:2432 length:1353 start_codon:yes stop_codon:yes gene_type:complete